jgi:putative MATE family efflux protein
VTPRVARAIGANDPAAARRTGGQAMLLAIAIGSVAAAIGVIFAGPIVSALGAEGRVADLSESYLRIRALASMPVLVVTVGHGWLRGAQDTRTPMLIVLAGGAINSFLDYLFIYPFGWGVQGAAWSTLIGQAGTAVAFFFLLHRRTGGLTWRIDRAEMRKLFSVGADLIVRAGAIVGTLTFVTAVASRMGVVILGAWQITMQVFTFLALSLDSVAIASQALVGRYLGADDHEAVRAIIMRLMAWGIGLGFVVGAPLLAFRDPIVRVFTDDPAVIAAAAGLIGWLAVAQPIAAAAFTLDGILIGASDSRFLARWMVIAGALFAVVAWASLEQGWGRAGLAAGATLWLAIRSVALARRLATDAWSDA